MEFLIFELHARVKCDLRIFSIYVANPDGLYFIRQAFFLHNVQTI